MHYFIYFSISEDHPMQPPTPEGMARMGEVMGEAFKSGKIVATGQLPKTTTCVELSEGEYSVTDGPFIESKEFIPGFTIIDVETREEAVEWAKQLRECMGDGVIKVARLTATGPEDIKQ